VCEGLAHFAARQLILLTLPRARGLQRVR
jgi:hypothetical protein